MLLIINKIISKLHLFHFSLAFAAFYFYSHSTYFHDHGGYNFFGLFLIVFLILILYLIVKVLAFIFKIKYKYKIFFVIFFIFSYNAFVNPTNCDDWPKGLNNTYIENDGSKYGCQIRFPKKCEYKLIRYTMDFSKLGHVTCKNKKKDARKRILKFSKSHYVNKNTTKFGFPLTNNDEGKKDGLDNVILKHYTSHNLMDMDKPIPSKLAKPEYIVDFSKDPFGELIINVNYNETLSIERKKLEKNSNPYSENVMILFIDSVSRANSIRQLKKTLNFFEQFMSYKGGHNKKYPKENFHSFQFFKYHTFKGLTHINFPKIFYGNDRQAKDLVRITKYFHENGYVMCYATDVCQKDNTRTQRGLTEEEMYDHQLLLCDPNAANLNSPKKRCLYGNLNTYHFFSYLNQFWRKYKNNRKLATIVINDAHEGTLEAIKYTDDVIYDFLISLYDDNLLKDSSIILLSDHGCGLPTIYWIHEFYQIEMKLPMLYIIVNDRKNVDYNKQYFYIQKNQQTFITSYDIYNTIGNLIFGDNYSNIQNKESNHDTPKSPMGKSLFENINQKERKPKLYPFMNIQICK